jgi:hypothetical protein
MDSKQFSVKFFISEHYESGMKGAMPLRLKDKGWDSYIPGFAPSHDLIDHGANEFGALYQEVQALGAILNLRGWEVDEGYYAGQCRSDFVAGDLVSSYKDAYYADSFRDLLAFPELPKFRLNRDERERFDEFFEALKNALPRYWESEVNDNCDPDCDECTPNWFFQGDNWEKTKLAMMYGFYKSQKRWGDLHVDGLRRQIDAAMQGVEKHRDELEAQNAVFTLKCEVGPYGASAHVVYPDNVYL